MCLVLRQSGDQRITGKHLNAVQLITIASTNTYNRVEKVSRIWGSPQLEIRRQCPAPKKSSTKQCAVGKHPKSVNQKTV